MIRGLSTTLSSIALALLVTEAAWAQCTNVTLGLSKETAVNFKCLAVNSIVGAQFLGDQNQFFLYATEPSGNTGAVLWLDEVVQLTRAAVEFGSHYTFSLEFDRRGDRDFKPEEIGSFSDFKKVLEGDSNPVVQSVRDKLGPVPINPSLGGRGDNAERQQRARLATALNDMLKEDLVSVMPPNRVGSDIRRIMDKSPQNPRRIRRLILEDLFGLAVNHDVGPRYVIRWSPVEWSDPLESLFSNGRTESVLLAADALLKAFATGRDLPAQNGNVVPTELLLCSDQIVNDIPDDSPYGDPNSNNWTGSDFKVRPYRNFFNLHVDYQDATDLPGQSLWFVEPQLVVEVEVDRDVAPQDCAKRFASSLTRYLPKLLEDQGVIGQRLRDLQSILILNRAIGLLTGVAQPNGTVLRALSQKAERIPNVPPNVFDRRLQWIWKNEPVGLTISGGVHMESTPPAPSRTGAHSTAATQSGSESAPAFVVTKVVVGGRPLLKIDISSIVGLNSR